MAHTPAIFLLWPFYLVPSLSVDVQHDGGSTIYAGSMLTLTCDILVNSVPFNLRDGVTVTTSWLSASGNMLATGGRITVNPAAGSGVSYSSTVVFNTVVTNNDGTYTCLATATHSSQFITGVTTPGEVTISPVGECNKVYYFEDIIMYTINICSSHFGTDCVVQYHSSSQHEPLQHIYPHLHCHCTNGCR